MDTTLDKTSIDVLGAEFSQDGKEAARARLRERRDTLLDGDRFMSREAVFQLLKLENDGLDEPLDASELAEVCREATYKRGLVPKERTIEFLTGKATRFYGQGKKPDEVRSLLDGLNRESCEEDISQDVIDCIVSEVMRGSTKSNRFTRTMLGDAMRDGVPEPEELEPDVLIKGDVHQIFTGPGDGKSWLALALSKNAVERGETTLFFDMENGPRIVTERLTAFGANAETVDEHLHYFYVPAMDMGGDALGAYAGLLDELKPDLLVFDSWIGFLAACGLDENSPTDIEEWANAYLYPAKARGCNVVILDHVPHDADRSRGATRKKDVVDVQWHLQKREDFDRGTVGYIQLTKKKDREAWLPERVGFSVGGTDDGFVFKRSSGPATDQEGDGLTPSAREALKALETFGDHGATYSEWRDATIFKGKPMGESTFRKARIKLMAGENPPVKQDGDTYYSTTAPHSTLTALTA